MRVVPYEAKYKKDFIEMNKKWIGEMPVDKKKFPFERADIAFERYI